MIFINIKNYNQIKKIISLLAKLIKKFVKNNITLVNFTKKIREIIKKNTITFKYYENVSIISKG